MTEALAGETAGDPLGGDPQGTALVVDDDDFFRSFVRRVLEDRFGGFDEAGTCQEAREKLSGDGYRLVLLDYRLPDGDGLDVLEEAPGLGSETPVVVLTGHGDEEVAARFLRAGATDYLTKENLTPTRLRRTVANALARRRAREEVERLSETLADTERVALLGAISESALQGLVHVADRLEYLVDDAVEALPDGEDTRDLEGEFQATLEAMERIVEPLASLRQLLTEGPAPGPADVADVSASLAEIAEHTAPPGVDVAVEAPPEAWAAVDPWALRYALSQVVNNAVEATDEGEVRLRVEADDGVRVAVADEGPGFPDEVTDQAYDLYVTTKEGHEGVGLTVARHVIELHGGTLSREDRPEGGTRMIVDLPAAEAP